MTFKDACDLANRIGIKEEKPFCDNTIILVLNDGSELHFISGESFECGTEETPDKSYEPPSVEYFSG